MTRWFTNNETEVAIAAERWAAEDSPIEMRFVDDNVCDIAVIDDPQNVAVLGIRFERPGATQNPVFRRTKDGCNRPAVKL
ncbi:MAG: hypothetical protein VB875_12490 [Pirellulales bacterium]